MKDICDLTINRIFKDKTINKRKMHRTLENYIQRIKIKKDSMEDVYEYNVFLLGNKEERQRKREYLEYKSKTESCCARCGKIIKPWEEKIGLCSNCEKKMEKDFKKRIF